MPNKKLPIAAPDLFQQIAGLIEQSQKRLAVQANSTLTLLFLGNWEVNQRACARKQAG